MITIALVACGDDKRNPRDDDDSPANVDDSGVSLDGGQSSEAGTITDAAGGPMGEDDAATTDDGGSTEGDGGAADDAALSGDADPSGGDPNDGGESDSGNVNPGDGGATDDASTGNGGDAGTGGLDASAGDASGNPGNTDAAAGGDASSDAGANDGSNCQVNDFRFGCGVRSGRFIEFASGYTYDTREQLVWSPLRDPLSDNEQTQGCGTPEFTLIDAFVFPSIDQVRELTAGCPSEACELGTTKCISEECGRACGACMAGNGPHASGRYCHPELTVCANLFTNDACDIGPGADCEDHHHWYYEAATGVFKLVPAGQSVTGRCVARVRGQLPVL